MDVFVKAQIGPPQEARRLLDRLAQDDFRFLPRDMSWLYGMTFLAEAALAIGDVERLTVIERLLRPFAGTFGLAISETSSGPVSRVLGLIAAAAGRHDEALDLLESAHRACAVSGLRTFELRTACDIARMLVQRGGPRDVERAAIEVEAAREGARSSGLIATEQEAQQVLAALAGEPDRNMEQIDAPPATQFIREGDAWRIGDGGTFHLRHSKGLAYLAMLLRTPGREHHALDLVSAGAGGAGTDRDGRSSAWLEDRDIHVTTGAIPAGGLDDDARRAYRDRLRELDVELGAAESAADDIRADRARWEIDALTRELTAAYGLAGRARPEGSAAERARQSVTKALREAIMRIDREDPELGQHLARAVRTGVYCSYDPDPSALRSWCLS
jgi:hypothetical protein